MVKRLTTFITCDACFVRFELELVWDYAVVGYPPAELLEEFRAYVLAIAVRCAWKVDGDRHVCPRCK